MSSKPKNTDVWVPIFEATGLGVIGRAIMFSVIPAWFGMIVLGELHSATGWACNLSYLATVTIFQLIVLVGGLFSWGNLSD